MRKRLSALNYSLRLLGYRGRSEKELIKRLSMKGYNEEEIKETVERLRSIGLINDRNLAVEFRNYAERNKNLGVMGVRNFLFSRGIPFEITEEVCKEIDEEKIAKKLVEKRLKGKKEEDTKKKIFLVLQRKGFSQETIQKVIKDFFNEEGD